MIGFIFYLFKQDQQKNLTPVPPHLGCTSEHVQLSSSAGVYTWGEVSGDIHFSKNNGESFLIISGYITEYRRKAILCQKTIIDQLVKVFDRCLSKDDVSEIAGELNGSFSILYINYEKRYVYTVTDRIASRSLWLKMSSDAIYISSHAIPVVRTSTSITYDPGGMCAHILYGTTVDPSKGIFKTVSCQKEGLISEYQLGENTASSKAWYKYGHKPDSNTSMQEWINLTSKRFIKSAARVLNTTEKPMLFLSGGIDSRIVGAALTEAGGKPFLCTLSDTVNLEVRVAQLVARILGCEHEVILRDEEWYLRTIPWAMFNSHGVYSWIHSHFSQIYSSKLSTNTVDSAILGGYSEAFSQAFVTLSSNRNRVLSPSEFLTEFDNLQLPNYKPSNPRRTFNLFQPDFAEEGRIQLKETILNRYKKIMSVSEDPLIVGDFFFRWQASCCLAPCQMYNDVRSVGSEKNLMYDNDLHQLLEVMPASVRFSKNLGARVVNRISPIIGLVPNSNSLLPLFFPKQMHRFSKKTKPVLGKIKRRFISNTYKTTGSWPHLPLLFTSNLNWRRAIEDNLLGSSTSLPSDIFNRVEVEKCWNEFCDGNINRHSDVERLLGLAYVNRFLMP